MRFVVEQWATEYGTSVEGDLATTESPVDVSVEVDPADWAPRRPGPAVVPPSEVAFVDGVRRVEARVWVDGDDGVPRQGICASYAAGVVRCDGAATVVDARVDRGLFCDGPGLQPIVTRHARFPVRPAGADSPDALSLALQGAMGDLERAVAAGVDPGTVLVVDGPLGQGRGPTDAVGYVKTHHVAYLPDTVVATVPALAPGERTPLFCYGDRFRRWSWYLRLPGERTHGWAGVVRCEADADRPIGDVVALADALALALPRFASEAHKDGRAPQNLYPIAGLERELRRRLGDPKLLYRSLRAASGATRVGPGPSHAAT